MKESWHIPRVSLAGSTVHTSSNRSNKSQSTPSTVSRNFMMTNDSSHKKIASRQQTDSKPTMIHGKHKMEARLIYSSGSVDTPPKRGSRSSQGSSGSNNCSQSISSGSLLLTAANLERFAEIQKRQNKFYLDDNKEFLNSIYRTNLMLASMPLSSDVNKDDVISIGLNFDFVKTKDVDIVSIASSTHFTMINGENGTSRTATGGICSSGKQVTVLITTMSLFFFILIIGMVYALELRSRDMPKS